MVVIAAAICTKSGKVIVSRQFVEITRSRIETLFTSFYKLAANNNKEYTYVDGPTVRFVYQPIEDLYSVLVTNKSSNIVEDIETLRLISALVSEKCDMLDEDNVIFNAFEIIFALDEIMVLGYREKVTQQQVNHLLEMDSQEEKMAEIVQRNQEFEAAKESKRRGKEIDKKRRELLRLAANKPTSTSSISSSQGDLYDHQSHQSFNVIAKQGKTSATVLDKNDTSYSLSDEGKATLNHCAHTAGEPSSSSSSKSNQTGQPLFESLPLAMGQNSCPHAISTNGSSHDKNRTETHIDKDGAVPQASEYLDTMRQELLAQHLNPSQVSKAIASSMDPSLVDKIHTQNLTDLGTLGLSTHHENIVKVDMVEKIQVKMDRDGNLQQLQVIGQLDVLIYHELLTDIVFQLQPKTMSTIDAKELSYKLHPSYNKTQFIHQHVIQLRDASRHLLVNSPNSVLKWRILTQDPIHLPLMVNFWPSTCNPEGVAIFVLDYEARKDMVLHDTIVQIPMMLINQKPIILHVDGETYYDSKAHYLEWKIPLIDPGNATGNIEFKLSGLDPEKDVGQFYPIQVAFRANTTMLNLQVDKVTLSPSEDKSMHFGQTSSMQVTSYMIE